MGSGEAAAGRTGIMSSPALRGGQVAASAICGFLETVAREVAAGNGAAAGLPTSLPAEAVADWLCGLREKIERSS